MVGLESNPYYVPKEPPGWKFQRRQTPYRVECPACRVVGRAYYAGGDSPDVRCRACNTRFSPAGHTVANGKAGGLG